MSEYDPLDIGSESYFILRNQLSDNNIIFNEEYSPSQINNNCSSLKETNDQISIISPELLNKKRINPDNFEQEFLNEEGDVHQYIYYEFSKEENFKVNNNKRKKGEKKNIKRKYEKDLISMKIQCHYITFVIKLINEILDFLKFDKKDRFKDIKYSIKKDVKKENFDKLKGQKLYEIITNKRRIF